MRRVGISEFKGKVMVDVREYYEKDGEALPGKKVCSWMMRFLILFDLVFICILWFCSNISETCLVDGSGIYFGGL